MSLALRSVAYTDTGPRRERNCDSFHVGPRVLAVADGVDDAPFGDVASALAVDHVRRLESEPGTLASAALAANEELRLRGAQAPPLLGMGTTLLAAFLGAEHLVWLSVGDSRLYLFREGDLHLVTLAAARTAARIPETWAGGCSVESSALLDGSPDVVVAPLPLEVHPGDRLLFGTRGLAEVTADDIHSALAANTSSLPIPGGTTEPAVHALIETARPRLAENLTVVVADVIEAS
ncbi:hypothetical protein GCM10027589_46330 [Actinocorallia lasiicapitis]